jgi:hypothetical protein
MTPKTCGGFLDLLAELAEAERGDEGLLSGELSVARDHAAACPECGARLHEYRRVVALLDEVPVETASVDLAAIRSLACLERAGVQGRLDSSRLDEHGAAVSATRADGSSSPSPRPLFSSTNATPRARWWRRPALWRPRRPPRSWRWCSSN